ncbi:MAG: SNF2-related protein, partial [Chloroflexota bacterium]|nr:SNF2-related protein [Chloroflexota bacterium]
GFPWPLSLPTAPVDATFRRWHISSREKVAHAYAVGWPDSLISALSAPQYTPPQPVWPLKKGTTALLASSGVQDRMFVEQDGETIYLKGQAIKVVEKSTTVDEETDRVITYLRDKWQTAIGVVRSTGETEVLNTTPALKEFMGQYGNALAREVLGHAPLYNLKPAPARWQQLGQLGLQRPALPGAKPGLLPLQKHAALALWHSLEKHKFGIIQGEMGLGKTTVALALTELRHNYPALVICPPQVTRKWQREAQEVIPGVQVRILDRIGELPQSRAPAPGWQVNDVAKFAADYQAGRLGEKAIAIVSSTGAKAGPGWAGAVATRYRVPSNEREGREKYLQLMQTYRELRTQLRAPSPEITEHLDDFRAYVAKMRRRVLDAAHAYPVCPHCGYVHYEQPRQDEDPIPVTFFRAFERKALRCTRPYSGWAMDKETGEHYYDADGKPVWLWVDQQQAPTVNGYHQFQIENDAEGEGPHAVPAPEQLTAPRCGTTLIEFGARYKKWSIADYIKDHYQNFFQFLVVDELHEYKGEST